MSVAKGVEVSGLAPRRKPWKRQQWRESFRACPEAEPPLTATAGEGKFPGLSRGGTSPVQRQQFDLKPATCCIVSEENERNKAITSHKYCCQSWLLPHALSLMTLTPHKHAVHIPQLLRPMYSSSQPLLLELSQVSEGEHQLLCKGDRVPLSCKLGTACT